MLYSTYWPLIRSCLKAHKVLHESFAMLISSHVNGHTLRLSMTSRLEKFNVRDISMIFPTKAVSLRHSCIQQENMHGKLWFNCSTGLKHAWSTSIATELAVCLISTCVITWFVTIWYMTYKEKSYHFLAESGWFPKWQDFLSSSVHLRKNSCCKVS